MDTKRAMAVYRKLPSYWIAAISVRVIYWRVMGGEEFVLILPNIDPAGLKRFAQNLCTAIHKGAIPHEYSSAAEVVTISLGAAVTIPAQDDPPHSLVEMADQALYTAKESGRNRVHLHTVEADD